MNLMDIMSAKASGGDEPQKRYREYVIETQSQGGKPLSFEEWFGLQNQKSNG